MDRGILTTLFLVSLMMGAFVVWRSTLFPELSALSAGFSIFPHPRWQRRRWDFVFWPTFAVAVALATGALGADRLLSAEVVLAVVLTGLVVFHSPAIPALSAGLLVPVLHMASTTYLLAVLIFSLLLLLIVRFWSSPESHLLDSEVALRTSWSVVAYGGLAALWVAIAFGIHQPFLAIPPLFVASYEQAVRPKGYHDTLMRIGLLVLGATIGAGLQLVSPWVVVPEMVAVSVVIGMLRWLHLPFLPMLPLTLLPAVIAKSALPHYVIAVGVASGVLMTSGWFIGKRLGSASLTSCTLIDSCKMEESL